MSDYLITVNEDEIQVEKTAVEALDMVSIDSSNFHLLRDNKAFEVEVLATDFLNKKVKLSVNGNPYEIKIEDEHDQKVKEMGLFAVTAQKVNSIKAPMPGLIVDVMVTEGQEISDGTPLIVLSAMKMENIILSQGDGIVKSIEVKKDDAVEKGQLIIEME